MFALSAGWPVLHRALLCPPRQVSSASFFCEACSSIFRVLLRLRQLLRTVCFLMLVVDFCSWLKNHSSNEEMKMFRVVRVVAGPSAYLWMGPTQNAVYVIPFCALWRRLSSASLNAWYASPPRNVFPNAFKKFCERTAQTVPPCQGQQPLSDLFTIFWRCLNLRGCRSQTRLRIGQSNAVPCSINYNSMAFAH